MLRDFAICHTNPYAIFGNWCPFKLRSWHSHPLSNGDSIVTLDLATEGTRDDLHNLESAGALTLLPTTTSGNALADVHLSHPDFKAAGVVKGDRTWDGMKKMLNHLGWAPLHPEYTPREVSNSR
jgi:hypothetical protein